MERLLAAIEAVEKDADRLTATKVVRTGPNRTHKEFRLRSEERHQAILRRCAADREIVNECCLVLSGNGDSGRLNGPLFARFVLTRLARGYGIQA